MFLSIIDRLGLCLLERFEKSAQTIDSQPFKIANVFLRYDTSRANSQSMRKGGGFQAIHIFISK